MQQESTFNQYAAPAAVVADVAQDESAPLEWFSTRGRLGRLRFLAWTTGASLIHNIVVGIVTVAVSAGAGTAVSVLLGLVAWVFSVTCCVRRCHDMNISGWWTLTAIIPVIALAWMFWPGSRGANRFGAPPPPNTWGVRLLGLLLPLLAFIGILAAVAIPQYKAYTDRARAAQSAPAP